MKSLKFKYVFIFMFFLLAGCGDKPVKDDPVPLGNGIVEFGAVSVTTGNVKFSYLPAWAETPPESVWFSGDLNKWSFNAEGYRFEHLDNGTFELFVKMVPGTYRYYYVINGAPVKNMKEIAGKILPQPTKFQTNADGAVWAVLEVGE